VGRHAAIDHVEEQALELFGDRAAAAGADLAVVEFADRRHLGGGAGEEGFVGDVDVVARQALRNDLIAEFRRDLDAPMRG
jgi:hypothetical protein